MMDRVLLIAEKNTVTRAIADVLNDSPEDIEHFRRRMPCTFGNSANPANPWVYEFTGSFRGKQMFFVATSTCGHLYNTGFSGLYKSRTAMPLEDLLRKADVEKKIEDGKDSIVNFIAEEGKKAKYLLLCLDNDNDGENICFEVIGLASGKLRLNPRSGAYGGKSCFSQKNIFRARFSSLVPKQISLALETEALDKPKEVVSKSVELRQEVDARVGAAFSRIFTLVFFRGENREGKDEISIGPCQTLTLAICVKRHDERENFVRHGKDRKIEVTLLTEQGRELTLKSEKFIDTDEIKHRVEKLKGEMFVRVVGVETSKGIRSRPPAMNTVELLINACKRLSISPWEVMDLAEKLYLGGIFTYPRTGSTGYASSFDVVHNLRQFRTEFAKNPSYLAAFDKVVENGIAEPGMEGNDTGVHPPVMPMKILDEEFVRFLLRRKQTARLTEAERQRLEKLTFELFRQVLHHFLMSLMPDCEYQDTKYILEVAGEKFTLTKREVNSKEEDGKQVKSWGFMEISKERHNFEENLDFPALTEGDVLTLKDVWEGEVEKPPSFLTEAECVQRMANYRIGTDGTIPGHIRKLVMRKYVEIVDDENVEPRRQLKPTELGIRLIHVLEDTIPDFVELENRKWVEGLLKEVADGTLRVGKTPEMVKRKILDWYQGIFQKLWKEKISGLKPLLELSPLKAVPELEPPNRPMEIEFGEETTESRQPSKEVIIGVMRCLKNECNDHWAMMNIDGRVRGLGWRLECARCGESRWVLDRIGVKSMKLSKPLRTCERCKSGNNQYDVQVQKVTVKCREGVLPYLMTKYTGCLYCDRYLNEFCCKKTMEGKTRNHWLVTKGPLGKGGKAMEQQKSGETAQIQRGP